MNIFDILVAPPPKAAQRRSNNTNGHQDLFGSDPFQPISKSSFNVSLIRMTFIFL
jgi:hypothetical protein